MFDQFKRNSKNHRVVKPYEITFLLSGYKRETHIVNFRSLDNLAVYLEHVQNDKVKVVDVFSLKDNAFIVPCRLASDGFMALMKFNNN